MTAAGYGRGTLRIVHLFPDLLNVYGDGGNVRALARRAAARGIGVEHLAVRAGDPAVPRADVFLIGGGQDREQVAVARELARVGQAIRDQVADGAALLAICGGYQSLGWGYRAGDGVDIEGPGVLDVRTEAKPGRLVGPVVAQLSEPSPVEQEAPRTLVGFENHSGRTWLGTGARAFAEVEIGNGNNAVDRGEGNLACPGDGGLLGLRIGTYLHGPLLPRNPHVADALIAAGLARGGPPVDLAPLDDTTEWQAHLRFAARIREHDRRERRIPGWVHRIVDRPRSLIGF